MVNQRSFDPKTPSKRQAEIREIIESKGVRLTPCVHCLHDGISIFEVGFRVGVRTAFRNRPGRFFSAAVIICDNCGHKSEFDGQTLGLEESRADAFD